MPLELGVICVTHRIHSIVTQHSKRSCNIAHVVAKLSVPISLQNVDYIGLDLDREHLLFYTSSPDAVRDLKVPLSIIRERGAMTISSDLADAHLYIFDR
jgi:hypothetical protein